MRDVFANHPVEVSLTQDHHVIQAFASHAANEPLTNRISFRCVHGCPEHLSPSVFHHSGETLPVLAVIVTNQKPWSFFIGCRFSQLLRDPNSMMNYTNTVRKNRS